MKSKLYENYGGYKVWARPLNKGRGFRYEVRQGNRVLYKSIYLTSAMTDAKARMEAFWADQARYLEELQRVRAMKEPANEIRDC